MCRRRWRWAGWLPGVATGEAARVALGAGAAALRAARGAKWEGSVACATGRRSLRRGGGLAGEASGGGWSECGGCPGNALRWLP